MTPAPTTTPAPGPGPKVNPDNPVTTPGAPVTFDPLANDSPGGAPLDPTTVNLLDRPVSRSRGCRRRRAATNVTDPATDGLVFGTANGTELDAHNVRRAFRRIVAAAGLDPAEWTPREMRHSFVSLLSESGVPLEHISRLVGHSGTAITEAVYRQQLRPVLDEGTTAMDGLFPERVDGSHSDSRSAATR